MPDLGLPASDGSLINLRAQQGTAVVFCYPYTGRPGFADPPNWDNIPGAHGSTPQAQAFSKHYQEFATLNVKIFGVSFDSTEWQQDFAKRNALSYLLVSDADQKFAQCLGLETFSAGQKLYLARRSFIIKNGVVMYDTSPVLSPATDAADLLTVLTK
jgi:peroxiredoxin